MVCPQTYAPDSRAQTIASVPIDVVQSLPPAHESWRIRFVSEMSRHHSPEIHDGTPGNDTGTIGY